LGTTVFNVILPFPIHKKRRILIIIFSLKTEEQTHESSPLSIAKKRESHQNLRITDFPLPQHIEFRASKKYCDTHLQPQPERRLW